MRGLRIGYMLTLSFLLLLTVVTFTFGFYPPPKGPKAPEYPTLGLRALEAQNFEDQYGKYDQERKQYDEQQKLFLQEKIVDYTRNVVAFWLISLIGFGLIGLILRLLNAEVVGAGFALTGLWAIVYGPIGFLMWYVNGLVRSFGARAEQDFSTEPILQTAAVICLVGVVLLTSLGFFAFRNKSPSTS